MDADHTQIQQLIDDIDRVIADIHIEERANEDAIQRVSALYRKSARNLIHYKAFRRHDLRSIQQRLGDMGLSRLTLAEGHVMASLVYTQRMLRSLIGAGPAEAKTGLSIRTGRQLMAEHTEVLLGKTPTNRRVRIMVTQPATAAHDEGQVHEMVARGMTCARINCAHDGPEVWLAIIENVRKAARALGRDVRIAMDLAGPKIRTGTTAPGARVRKFSPQRDESGQVINPATVILTADIDSAFHGLALPVDGQWLARLEAGQEVHFRDTRGKKRRLKVISTSSERAVLHGYETAYIATGTLLRLARKGGDATEVGPLPARIRKLVLHEQDLLTVHKGDQPGEPARYDIDGRLLKHAAVSCAIAEVFDAVQPGEPVLFDDGKIAGVIEATRPDAFDVRIVRALAGGSRLKAEAGMNFPVSRIAIKGLTAKDKEDLRFVARHADVVNFSFVNDEDDVEALLAEMRKIQCINTLHIILKIETRKAFDHLKAILLAAMQVHHIGVMIARGDLAIETGWDNIGWVQSEILAVCSAAHIPVVWATQVLDNMARKGLPSRSEITDATSSLRAECVMLNKGPYILQAISLLNKILTDMENYQEKNAPMLPYMSKFV